MYLFKKYKLAYETMKRERDVAIQNHRDVSLSRDIIIHERNEAERQNKKLVDKNQLLQTRNNELEIEIDNIKQITETNITVVRDEYSKLKIRYNDMSDNISMLTREYGNLQTKYDKLISMLSTVTKEFQLWLEV